MPVLKSQSPQVGAMFQTVNFDELVELWNYESQSPQVGAMFQTDKNYKNPINI